MSTPTTTEQVSILETRGLTKRFGPNTVLNAVDFAISPGEIRALCGENGAGKSTLVKLLTGLHAPDAGSISINGRPVQLHGPRHAQELGVAFVSQELSIVPHLTALENLWLGHRDWGWLFRRRQMTHRAREVLARVGLEELALDTPASSLSLGQRQLLEIARMLLRDARVFILDEPTATLSDSEISLVFAALKRLRGSGCAVIFITHRLSEVFEICDRATILRGGRLIGTFDIENVDRELLIEHMLGRALGEMYPQDSYVRDEVVLSVRGLTVPGILKNLSFDVAQGEIVCLAGQIGSGATDAVRALAGLVYQATGEVRVGHRPVKLGSVASALRANMRFVSEDRAAEGLFLAQRVDLNMLATQLGIVTRYGVVLSPALRNEATARCDKVQLDKRRLRDTIGQLSGGNQQKVAIGRSLSAVPQGVLLLNEPTRGVDVGARAEIYQLLKQFCQQGYGVVMMSTDIEEVVGLSDRVITLYRGEKVGEYRKPNITAQRIMLDVTHAAQPREAAA